MTTANWEEQQTNKTMGQLQLFVTKKTKTKRKRHYITFVLINYFMSSIEGSWTSNKDKYFCFTGESTLIKNII